MKRKKSVPKRRYYSRKLKEIPVKEMDLLFRAEHFLTKANITTFGQLVDCTEEDLRRMGIGTKGVDDIRYRLATMDAFLRGEHRCLHCGRVHKRDSAFCSDECEHANEREWIAADAIK